jgi:hypothetical protein
MALAAWIGAEASAPLSVRGRGTRAPLVTPATPIAETAPPTPLCAGRAVLVTRTGERIETERGFEVEGSRVRFLNPSGTLVAVRLSEIDVSATTAAELLRCGGSPAAAAADLEPASPRDPLVEVIDAIVELGVQRGRLEALADEPEVFRVAIEAVVSVASELERRTRSIERTHRLDTVGGMIAAAPAYRELAGLVRSTATRYGDTRVRGVLEDLAIALDEVARLAAEEPERAIEEFRAQAPPPA